MTLPQRQRQGGHVGAGARSHLKTRHNPDTRGPQAADQPAVSLKPQCAGVVAAKLAEVTEHLCGGDAEQAKPLLRGWIEASPTASRAGH